MKIHRIATAFLFTLLFGMTITVDSKGQGGSTGNMPVTEGTEYLIAFMQVWAAPTEKPLVNPLTINITSAVPCSVRITSESSTLTPLNKEYAVEPNTALRVPIPTSYMMSVHGDVLDGAIRVSSTAPVSVSSQMAWYGNGESIQHLPLQSWGSEYYTFNMYQDRYGQNDKYTYRPAQAVLISGQDSTLVTIRTSLELEDGGLDITKVGQVTYQIRMKARERVLLRWKVVENLNKDWASDPTGALISSDRPIAVLSGHTKCAVMRMPDKLPPTGAFAAEAHFVRNTLQEALLPNSMAGTEFVTVPFDHPIRRYSGGLPNLGIDNDKGDVVRFIALQSNTEITRSNENGEFVFATRIDAGKVFTAEAVDVATVWKADKPVMCMQYGKSWAHVTPPKVGTDGSVQGHPTVESGMPMMQVVPPVDRWIPRGAFYSPEGMDNYVNIVVDSASKGVVEFDGNVLSSFGPGTPIAGSRNVYYRRELGAGSHTVQSTVPNAHFMAWSYGNLDGLQQGRAHAAPIGVGVYEACEDSIATTIVDRCGYLGGQVELRSKNGECGTIHSMYVVEAVNCVLDTMYGEGYRSGEFRLRILEGGVDAHAVVRVLSTSGAFTDVAVLSDSSNSPRISFHPDVVELLQIPVGETTCSPLTIRNLSSTRSVTIDDLALQALSPSLTIIPTDMTIAPGDSATVQVCATLSNSAVVKDTLHAKVDCYSISGPTISVLSGEQRITVSDIQWRVAPGDRWHHLPVRIANSGEAVLTITGFEWEPDTTTYFKLVDAAPSFPFTLAPGASNDVTVAFNPRNNTSGDFTAGFIVHSNAVSGSDTMGILMATVDEAMSVDGTLSDMVSIAPQPLRLSTHRALNIALPVSCRTVSIANPLGQQIAAYTFGAGEATEEHLEVPSTIFASSGMYVIAITTSSGVASVPVLCIE